VTVIALLEAATALLDQGWQPQRTLMFAFGQDEEVTGGAGAGGCPGPAALSGGGVWRLWSCLLTNASCWRPPARPVCARCAAKTAELLRSRGVELDIIWDEGAVILE
jgi:hypothetical protein